MTTYIVYQNIFNLVGGKFDVAYLDSHLPKVGESNIPELNVVSLYYKMMCLNVS